MALGNEQQIAKGTSYATDDGVRMEGYAHHGGYFNVPLIQLVHTVTGGGELWQGGCIDGMLLPGDFDFVLSLYPWERYSLGPSTERLEVEIYDSLDQTTEQADALADLVFGKVAAGAKVLVHCQAGLNRSALVTALVLVKSGLTPDEAIAVLRTQRSPEVLCNSAFEYYVRNVA